MIVKPAAVAYRFFAGVDGNIPSGVVGDDVARRKAVTLAEGECTTAGVESFFANERRVGVLTSDNTRTIDKGSECARGG